MTMTDLDIKRQIENSLKQFTTTKLAENARGLFNALGYQSDKTVHLASSAPQTFIAAFDARHTLNAERALLAEWASADLIFQLTTNEVAHPEQRALFEEHRRVDNTIIESYVFLAIGLTGNAYTRTQLAAITREVNKIFPMPALILFQHGATLTLAVIDRRLHKRDQAKDVLEKVTLIKDIRASNPHRAHIEILSDLALSQLRARFDITSWVDLHAAWRTTLDTSEMNKRFFKEVANWYFWAVQRCKFPQGAGKNAQARNETSLIRLITRLIFVWFLREMKLAPEDLFDPRKLSEMLKYDDPNKSTYYKAILQNLFFATLNQEMNTPDKPDNRKFRSKAKGAGTRSAGGRDPHYMVHNLYRYESYFKHPDEALQLFGSIPFLNGGLFECLDRQDPDDPVEIIRIDGFSDRPDNELVLPDELFFGVEREVDLNEVYGTHNQRYRVRGLIDIFSSYKFTIEENTPIEEDVALDPELLGHVFENLLAAYNPETGVTARKQTGSFYTPREIVDYMVDESLLAYLQTKLADLRGLQDLGGLEARLRHLLAYNAEPHQFTEAEVACLIEAIDALKLLDPACGSGAFPMGYLHKLVFILGKLDPGNARWQEKQIAKASEIEDSMAREAAIAGIEQAFERHHDNYGRKLYLIQNCIYGVDIQPIAVQIAKLRCFLALVVDQKADDALPNRGILPLPNLETNFVAANTLLSVDKPAQPTLYIPDEIEKKEKELADVRRKHFSARTLKTKNQYREKDAALRAELAGLLKQQGFPPETTLRLAYWNPYDQNASADFFDSEWMFGITEGFDIVAGNPPYIKEYTFREAFDGLRDSPYYQGKTDLWYFFACMGLDALRENTGILTFIATNNWVTNFGASVLRNKMVTDATLLKLLDFGDYKIFESADIQTMVMICLRNNDKPKHILDFRQLVDTQTTFDDVHDLLNRNPNPRVRYLAPEFDRKLLKDKSFGFSSNTIEQVLNKLAGRANFKLDARKEVAQGIVAPQDAVNRASKAVLGKSFEIGDGIFVLSNVEKKAMPLTADETDLLKPFYTTSELHKYYGDKRNRYWVIYTDSSFSKVARIRPYPNLKKHLDRFTSVITSDNHPYGLHRSRDEHFFKGDKIMSLRKCSEPTFTYTDFDCYVSQTFYVIQSRRVNLKYLTGLLNSKLVAFWLRYRGKMQGHQFQIDKEPLLAIPLVSPPLPQQTPVVVLVDKILAAKRANPDADVSAWEREIDQLVYQLYGLTKEEIGVIERSGLPSAQQING